MARIASTGEQIFQVKGAGNGALGHDVRPDLVDRIHDFLERHQETRHRHWPRCVDNRILGRDHLDRPVEAGIERQVGKVGLHAGDDTREGGAEGRIIERADATMAAGEVVDHLVALDGEFHPDRNEAFAGRRIAVDIIDRFPTAIGQLGDALARRLLDIILHFHEAGDDRVLAVFIHQAEDFAFGHARRLGLGAHVADHRFWIARIGRDHVSDIFAQHALVDDADRRYAYAFAEHFLGIDVKRARHAAADIRPMAVRLAIGDDLVADENRADQAHIVEMGAAGVGVVDHENVARLHIALEGADHILAGVMQRADMNGDILIALGDGIAIGIIQRRGEIAIVDDERITGSEHLLGHLVDDGDEGVF